MAQLLIDDEDFVLYCLNCHRPVFILKYGCDYNQGGSENILSQVVCEDCYSEAENCIR